MWLSSFIAQLELSMLQVNHLRKTAATAVAISCSLCVCHIVTQPEALPKIVVNTTGILRLRKLGFSDTVIESCVLSLSLSLSMQEVGSIIGKVSCLSLHLLPATHTRTLIRT